MSGQLRLVAAGAGLVLAVAAGAFAVLAVGSAQSRPVQSRQWDNSFDGVARVVVHIDEGDLRVAVAPTGTRATVGTRLRWNTKREPRYVARLDGDTLTVRAYDCAGRFLRSTCDADVRMTVPAAVHLEVTADTADVEAVGVRGPVRVTIDSGNANLRDLTGTIRTRMDSGDLTATGLTSPAVDVELDSGNVRLEFTAAPTEVLTSNDTSDVVILVPDGSGPYAVRTRTDSGTARVAVSTGDNQDHRIAVTNDSGDITIGYLDPGP
jgi:hypothetical protein